ncbi:hypothetical protein TRIATDRAFT_88567 [Trichoderma atroviride IMI 206040]|uniref:Dienelactone hydrolase domain-containing protein n=1 Tax=Hypocrea atroviridis (strain ATCC 20476 / IMI 206040) TaxID=452589 RepID=G9NTL4_HYPAI|nr:uncharacterized protein TRIATDRAFT_88567 [Trichoderma atroviride IMI 206040]EHK46055.1 hypothetical protein TRIATDRAFT_88567 [Trichoderma atroviride IMI 206040]
MASHPRTLHEGDPKGTFLKIDGGINAYLATPSEENARKGVGILFIPEILGIYPNSQLLADGFAAKGYTTLIPDVFNGDAIPLDRFPPADLLSWLAKGFDGNNPHTPEYVDPIIIAAIKKLRELGVSKIGAVGYSFGGKYVVRHFKNGIDAGFVAHPSFVEEDELAALAGPLSIAAPETDRLWPAPQRHKAEAILVKTGQPYQITLFSGVAHGFGIRGDPDVRLQRFAKEQAFNQAVAWFDEHLLEV